MAISIARFFKRLRILLCFHSDAEQDDDSIVADGIDAGVDYTKKLSESSLALIFVHCFTLSVHSSSPFIPIYPSAAPLVLSQVSTRWRRIALAEPEIWSSIYVRNNTRQEILQLWLTRAGTTSDLNLRIQAVHIPEDLSTKPNELALHPLTRNVHLHTSTHLGRAWSFLASQIHRWRRIDIDLDVQTVFDFLELPLTNATMLNDLSITVVVRDAPALPTKLLDYLRDVIQSPTFKLQKLSWECIPTEGMTMHVVWGSLSKVHLSMGVTMDQSVKFLRACVRAEDVTLACITDDSMVHKEHELQLEAAHRELMTTWFSTFPPQRHKLPYLQRLSIGMGGVVGDCIPIVQFFILPALISLEVQSFDTSARSWALLEGFFERSARSAERPWNFRKLSIVDYNMTDRRVIELLSAPELGKTEVLQISCYTRRSIRIQYILSEVERLGGSKELEYFEDAWRGTWIERR